MSQAICFCGVGTGMQFGCDRCFLWFHAECANECREDLQDKDEVVCPMCVDPASQPLTLSREPILNAFKQRKEQVLSALHDKFDGATEYVTGLYEDVCEGLENHGKSNFNIALLGNVGSGKTTLWKAISRVIFKEWKINCSSRFPVVAVHDELPERGSRFHSKLEMTDEEKQFQIWSELVGPKPPVSREQTLKALEKARPPDAPTSGTEFRPFCTSLQKFNTLENLTENVGAICKKFTFPKHSEYAMPVKELMVTGNVSIPGTTIRDTCGFGDSSIRTDDSFKKAHLILITLPLIRFETQLEDLIQQVANAFAVMDAFLCKTVVVCTKTDEVQAKFETPEEFKEQLKQVEDDFRDQLRCQLEKTYGAETLKKNEGDQEELKFLCDGAAQSVPLFFVSFEKGEMSESNESVDKLMDYIRRVVERESPIMRALIQERIGLENINSAMKNEGTNRNWHFNLETCKFEMSESINQLKENLNEELKKNITISFKEFCCNFLLSGAEELGHFAELKAAIQGCAKKSEWPPTTIKFLDGAVKDVEDYISSHWSRHMNEIQLLVKRVECLLRISINTLFSQKQAYSKVTERIRSAVAAVVRENIDFQEDLQGQGMRKRIAEKIEKVFKDNSRLYKRVFDNVVKYAERVRNELVKAMDEEKRKSENLEAQQILQGMADAKDASKEEKVAAESIASLSSSAASPLTLSGILEGMSKRVKHFCLSESQFLATYRDPNRRTSSPKARASRRQRNRATKKRRLDDDKADWVGWLDCIGTKNFQPTAEEIELFNSRVPENMAIPPRDDEGVTFRQIAALHIWMIKRGLLKPCTRFLLADLALYMGQTAEQYKEVIRDCLKQITSALRRRELRSASSSSSASSSASSSSASFRTSSSSASSSTSSASSATSSWATGDIKKRFEDCAKKRRERAKKRAKIVTAN